MWVYTESDHNDGGFEVGFFHPDGFWEQEGWYEEAEEAARRVNYLNGGSGAPYPESETTRKEVG